MNGPTLPPSDHQPRPYDGPTAEEVLRLRQQYVSPAIFTYYREPLMLVEGCGQYVWDERGRRYLDAFGGIVTISVGHSHPAVVEAAHRQLEQLQHTSTIYLHPNLPRYAEMLAARMPGDLNVCYIVNSGSEANDLAILMARAFTGNFDVIALRNAYHGNNQVGLSLTGQRTWKFNVPHSFGVHHALMPDPYRGPWGCEDPEAGRKYAGDVKDLIERATSGQVAGFIAESIQGAGGVVVFPDGYLEAAYAHVRGAGGLCIADEVQSGFGRTGANFWGFENQGVIPDIVTMAKGIGNGAPLAAVVTRREIAETLTSRIHFNTFGGNPVVCAQGMAVLEVIEREHLQENALRVGGHLKARLAALQEKHELIGDVRGQGLMLGVELVTDRVTKDPATAQCAQVLERSRDLGLLVGKSGMYGNTLRITPPLCVTVADADFLADALDLALGSV
ncbi:MAG: hypothetical protein QOF51_1336 [Chloroflexota bacterium]|jgi:alanine-glyoxylate transaminase/(R)-3-amino-2-methylpropionate-pyruvate transaminase|nr:hypothetical protein [Chloroflexota bacterium]